MEEILDYDHYWDIVGAILISFIALVVGFVAKKQRSLSHIVNLDVEKQAKKSKSKLNLKENKRVQL
jgi:hypothetical protein